MNSYVELVEKSIANRGKIVPVSEINIDKRPYEAYTSLFTYNDAILTHIKKSSSMAKYEAPVAIRYVWIDFDDDSIDNAKRNVLRFLADINEKYDVNPEILHVYFSGNKGFHVGIPSEVIGIQGIYDKDMPLYINNFVKNLTSEIECVDYKIYNHTRLFRLPYSLNVKSNLYKIRLPINILSDSSSDEIMGYAADCVKMKVKHINPELNKKLSEYYISTKEKNGSEAIPIPQSENKTSVFRLPSAGGRNDLLHKQAVRLFNIKELKLNEVSDIMSLIYELLIEKNGNGFRHSEFINLMNSAYRYARLNNLGNIRMNTLENLIYRSYESIRNSDYVPTGFKVFDDDLGGGLKLQNVYSLIGKAGTKKSLLAQHISIHNAINYDNPIIYFNMEMSSSQIFKRVFKRILNRDIEKEIEEGLIEEDDLQESYNELNKSLKNNFYIVDNSNLSCKDFSSVIQQVEENRKQKVKLIIVDSMNCMETKGNSEVLTALENTKELKELAKSMKVAVLMINHVTAECPEHLRDSALYARGGQKIKDNNDAHFCLSKIIDRDSSNFNTEPKDYVYRKELVYVRYHNKRDSGETIDRVLELEDNLDFKEKQSDPKSFEVYMKR